MNLLMVVLLRLQLKIVLPELKIKEVLLIAHDRRLDNPQRRDEGTINRVNPWPQTKELWGFNFGCLLRVLFHELIILILHSSC
jgi:hypothetical protein